MPLSDDEYERFFRVLNSPHRVSAVCSLRALYGCQNSLIQTLDQYENHGVIPEGRVCSDLAEGSTFPDFCSLTFYRCTLKKYFVKRILCPEEMSVTAKQKLEIDHVAVSSTYHLNNHVSPASAIDELLSEVPFTVSALSEAASAEQLTIPPDTSATESMTSLLAVIPEDSTAADMGREIALALPAESFLGPDTSTKESLPELLAATAASIPTATEAHFILPTAPTTEVNTESTSLEVEESSALPVASTESLLDLFSPSAIYPELPMPGSSTTVTTTETPPQLSGNVLDEMSQEPEDIIEAAEAATESSFTTSAASTPSSVASILALNAKEMSSISSGPEGPPKLFIQIPSFLLQHHPHSNSSVQVFIISAGGQPAKVNPQDIAVITPHPETTAMASMVHEVLASSVSVTAPNSAPSSHPLASLLWDHRAHHLIQELQDLLVPGKEVPKRQLAATSLELLRALYQDRMDEKAKKHLGLKSKHQR